ncbi:DegT/DnrJ/EryC1/StrS family aminotransferase [Maritalea mediterranea]|uniref:DegT/DnrJ/EryC1/StrS family aminotransferase n=1 Tax=Maritalea mediterranea TaxID=2909667 RepID=A0ABS9E485_9HYPH|nr:DegT/DnrJ/EryC1/StrS family aminotransferase [Maritalea mediterranea]MCF4097690.1 DegT/DnrJ/EryC1/StrS family aminotransferase [Maritalea mediterranea]
MNDIPVFKPLIGPDEIGAATQSLEMGWLGMGSYVAEFEEKIGEVINAPDRFVSAVSTGTAALHVALLVAGVKPGDEVIVSAFNCSADYQAISWVGADIVFCDCDDDTLEMDIDKAEALVSDKTKAIIIMDYDCIISDYDKVEAFANKHNLRVIHDACHSFGSFYKGKPVGSYSDICVFSFDPVKTITCLDGGAVVVRTEEEQKYVRELRLLGMQQPSEVMYQNKRAWTFDVERVGYRYHMLNLHAAIGVQQIAKLDQIRATRAAASKRYSERLASVAQVRTPNSSFDEVNPFLYYIRVPQEDRDDLRAYLKEKGIDTGIHWQPGHWFSLWKDCRKGDLSVTDAVGHEILSLPLHSMMELSVVDQVSDTIGDFFANKAA